MLRRTFATLAAGALVVTGMATTPAAADNDDVARALAAIAGVAVLGAIIHNRNTRDDNVVTRTRPTHANPVFQPDRRVQDRGRRVQPRRPRHVDVTPRPIPRRVQRRTLPQHCFRSFDTRQGRYHMFGRRCLLNSNVRIERLPQHCAQRIRTHNGRRNGFDARCLRRAGYSLARR